VTADAPPRTVAWFHCFAGIAGDMALGSLLDAGADLDEVRGLLRRMPLPGWRLETQPALRGGIACTRALVGGRDDHVVVRTHAHIAGLIAEGRLPERVARRSLAVFAKLAGVEGQLHRRSPEQVHFHEVGGHDAVIDVVGTAAALEVLGVDEVQASAVATGTGVVRTAHGLLPNPAPAVVRLLQGVPTYGRAVSLELTTPTGAALLAALATSFGPLPPMVLQASGFGAGGHELDGLPNCTQVVLGSAPAAEAEGDEGQPMVLLEANLDDATGEQLAHAVTELLEAGANDAWLSPVLMKKGRPGHVIHVLCDPARAPDLRRILRSSTGTLGVRAVGADRWAAARRMTEVSVQGERVRMKIAPGRAKPEFDDVAKAARTLGLSPGEIASRAEEAWRQREEPEVGPDDEPA
jgi:uncharacterized protein (TIGR00299 family) protein